MFNRRNPAAPHNPAIAPDADAALFHNLRRGVANGKPSLADAQSFPSASQLIQNNSLRFDPSNQAGKLFLGLVGGRMEESDGIRSPVGGHLLGIHDDRHAWVYAGSRAGKGVSHCLPVLATWPGPAIIIDPKLDLATETARLRERVFGPKMRIGVIDPFRIAGPSCDDFLISFNPMQRPLGDDDDDLIDLAGLIADALVLRTSEQESHWDTSAAMLLQGIILHVLTFPKYQRGRDLSAVYTLLMTAAEGAEDAPAPLAVEMSQNEAADGTVLNLAAAFYDKEERERSGVLSTARKHCHFLSYRRVREAFGDSETDLGTMHTTPSTLYVGVPPSKSRECAGIMRMVINLALATFERGAQRRDFQHQQGRHPVLIMIDEFFALGRLERLEAAAGQVAGYGVKLYMIAQDLGQTKALYPSTWETFLANAGTACFFGNNDTTTLAWLERRLGQTPVLTPSRSDPTYHAAVQSGSRGNSYSVGSHPLMSIAEIARTFAREDPYSRQLVLSAAHGPMITQRIFYDRHEAMRGLFDEHG